MINLKPSIYKALQSVCENVNSTYPNDWVTFPVVLYTETENKPYRWTSEGEALTQVEYKVDVWIKEGSTASISNDINNALLEAGMYRTSSVEQEEPNGLKHKVMRFKAIINTNTGETFIN